MFHLLVHSLNAHSSQGLAMLKARSQELRPGLIEGGQGKEPQVLQAMMCLPGVLAGR